MLMSNELLERGVEFSGQLLCLLTLDCVATMNHKQLLPRPAVLNLLLLRAVLNYCQLCRNSLALSLIPATACIIMAIIKADNNLRSLGNYAYNHQHNFEHGETFMNLWLKSNRV